MEQAVVYSSSDAKPLEDQIVFGNRPFNLEDFIVTFKMRSEHSTTLVVDSTATVEDATLGKVSYFWQTGDLDTQGEYRAWWSVDTGDGTFDTEEFDLVITTHGPGLKTRTGAFYEFTKSHFPSSWSHLENALGDDVIQREIEVVKKTVFGTDVTVAEESNYDIRIQAYIGKLSAIQIIPRAIEYWMNQHQSLSATGTNENVSFPDRVDALWKLYERLLREVARDKEEIEVVIGIPTLKPLTGVPGVSGGTDEGFTTPLAQDYLPDYLGVRRGKRRFNNTLW